MASSFVLLCLVAAAFPQAPFAGKWKLNTSRHPIVDGADITYSSVGSGKQHYAFHREYDFGFDSVDYPTGLPGRTIAWTPDGTNAWNVVEKANGKPMRNIHVVLSSDGKTLVMTSTWFNPGNQTAKGEEVFARVSGGPGLNGTWRSIRHIEEPDYLYIAFPAPGQMYQYLYPSGETWAGPLDGTLKARQGPWMAKDTLESYKLVAPTKMFVQRAIGEHILNSASYEVSADGKTLTMQLWIPGKDSEKLTLVLDRVQ